MTMAIENENDPNKGLGMMPMECSKHMTCIFSAGPRGDGRE